MLLHKCHKYKQSRDKCEMVQQKRAFATIADYLSSTPKSHMVEREKRCPKAILWTPRISQGRHVHTYR